MNEIVTELAQEHGSRYRPIVGDERTLEPLPDASFDLALTVSVLDHIPSRRTVAAIIRELVRLSSLVILVEPWIAGVDGDVSGKPRSQVAPMLERGDKRFAAHSYLWDYDARLAELPVTWTKTPNSLHAASLGTFYKVYSIRPAAVPHLSR